MSNAKPWTPKQLQLMQQLYPTTGPTAMSRIVNHSPKACQERASEMGLTMTKEALSAMRRELSKAPAPKPRQPFEDVPDEYVKVSSIWRVGVRCKRLNLVQNSECAHEAA